jgi:uncharacterized membrane protein
MTTYGYIFLLAFVGLVTSLYILIKKYRREKIICLMGQNCNIVSKGPYNSLFGLANEAIGVGYFFLIMMIALYSLTGAVIPSFILQVLITSLVIAGIYSFYLIYTQLFVLKNICGLCIIANISNFAILFLFLSHS